MSETFDTMPFMPWTPEDVRGLVELADTRGVRRRELAEEFIGCSESLLSYYLNGKKEPHAPLHVLQWSVRSFD